MSGAPRALAVGLDLGTTRIKAAWLTEEGRLAGLTATPTPPLSGSGLVREGDPEALLAACRSVLDESRRGLDPALPLGIASQRSSFLIWRRSDGGPVTPVVSWQDRRADGWCRRHAGEEERVRALTGLRLSPHYAGPKLATLIEAAPELRPRLASGELCFGTLETWLGWRWSAGVRFQTDLGMAARTLLVDAARGEWCDELLELFGVPRGALARIAPTCGAPAHAIEGGLVLAGPLMAAGGTGARSYALEGTINAGGKTADRMAPPPTEWPARSDPADAFCLPDENGLGAPYWRARMGLSFSATAQSLDAAAKRRLVVEGLLFRARGMLEDLCAPGMPQRLLVSGGLSADPIVAAGLASLMGRPVELLEQTETALLGAARMAAGLAPLADVRSRRVDPGPAFARLRERYPRWKAWVAALLR